MKRRRAAALLIIHASLGIGLACRLESPQGHPQHPSTRRAPPTPSQAPSRRRHPSAQAPVPTRHPNCLQPVRRRACGLVDNQLKRVVRQQLHRPQRLRTNVAAAGTINAPEFSADHPTPTREAGIQQVGLGPLGYGPVPQSTEGRTRLPPTRTGTAIDAEPDRLASVSLGNLCPLS